MEGEASKDVMTSSTISGSASDTTATSSDNESWTILDEDEALEDNDITVSVLKMFNNQFDENLNDSHLYLKTKSGFTKF